MKKYLILIACSLSILTAKAQTNDVHIDAPPITPKSVDTSQVYTAVQKPASFPGGFGKFYIYLQENIKYPASIVKGQPAQHVFVQFLVMRDGSLTNVRVIRGASPDMDAEAIRVVKASSPWIPGEQNGVKIKQAYTVPISFAEKN